MKRLFMAVICAVLALTGCRAGKNDANLSDKVSVVATIFAAYDFTREIAGDAADVTMLLPPASEIHSFEPTPKDILTIRNCDIFIYVGGESDKWVDGVLASMDLEEKTVVKLMDSVRPVLEEIVAGMEAKGEDAPSFDEHVWTSPQNAALIVKDISEALIQADPANAETYVQNTEDYLIKLAELNASFQAVDDGAVRRTVVFGDRFPFRYLVDAYGLEYYAAFPGCAEESEPSARTVAFLIDTVKAEEIPVVFHTEMSNMKIANIIAEDTGAKVMLLHSCHNISKDDFLNGVSYMELMNHNVEALKEALW